MLTPQSPASSTEPSYLYVSCYSGIIVTLKLHKKDHTYDLEYVSRDHNCGASPSWLTLDDNQQTLICVDEGLSTPNGSITSYRREAHGKLKWVATMETTGGPVSSVIYGSNNGIGRAIALAHYGGSAVSTFSIADDSSFAPLQNLTFTLPHPGPVSDRQEASHPHQVILDPTGQFILAPDLGSDVIRVFRIDSATNFLSELEPFTIAPGSGPRHAVFWSPSGAGAEKPVYLYLVTELANTLISYAVTYPSGGARPRFEKVFETNTFGGNAIPAGAAAAEIAVSPDNRFLLVSNRNDGSFGSSSRELGEANEERLDSIASFLLHDDGSMAFRQLSPAGGGFPRHLSINRAGNLVAVGLQSSQQVAILPRDAKTGELSDAVARFDVGGEVTAVLWA